MKVIVDYDPRNKREAKGERNRKQSKKRSTLGS
jgi:hypothetical protein